MPQGEGAVAWEQRKVRWSDRVGEAEEVGVAEQVEEVQDKARWTL